jgi:hypothetical protein
MRVVLRGMTAGAQKQNGADGKVGKKKAQVLGWAGIEEA